MSAASGDPTESATGLLAPTRPLQVAALVKQIPVAESMTLGPDGRLRREGLELEMNAYCRRAVAQGVELARASGGTCTVVTLGPESAEDVLREAIAWGADRGIHLCDPALAGSDTLATARALAAALARTGPFDLVLVGRNSLDGDTGQVGPELAELLDLPFACGVRRLALEADVLTCHLELDDGSADVRLALPALLSVAERLCDPCKVPPEGRAAVAAERIHRLSAPELGPGPWGEAGSPTRVGAVRAHPHRRDGAICDGPLAEQVTAAMAVLEAREALAPGNVPESGAAELAEEGVRSLSAPALAPVDGDDRAVVLVVLEPSRPSVGRELLGAAGRLAAEVGGRVVAFVPPAAAGADDGPRGADEVVLVTGSDVAEDVARALCDEARERPPWAVLAPSTSFGREVAARAAAGLGAGLVGDAIGLEVVDGVLVAAKPAFSGALVADITCTSPIQLVTVRPGVLPTGAPSDKTATVRERHVEARGRVILDASARDDDVEVLARAEVVIGVGAGVAPEEYPALSPLAALLGAQLAATRKVTDNGWAPRARQVGITGRSLAPRLYVAIGLSGKFNHMAGVRSAGTVLAVNRDPEAPVFSSADVGIVGDWHEVVPLLVEALRARATAPPRPAGQPVG